MSTARRLYLYIVAAVSLGAVAAGLFNLASVVVDAILPTNGVLGGGVDQPRSQISLAIALVAVGLPIWLIHWGLAERGVRRVGEPGDDDRRSAIRGMYLLVVEAASIAAVVVTCTTLLSDALRALLGDTGVDRPVDALAAVVVGGPVWAYHAMVIDADSRRTDLSDPAAGLPRLYRYATAFVALVVGLSGAGGAVTTGLKAAIEGPDLSGSSDWWIGELSWTAALAVVGLGAWGVHWMLLRRGMRSAARRHEDERRTRLRGAYFGAVTLASATTLAMAAAASLAGIGRWILGAEPSDPSLVLEGIIGPLITAVPFVIAWWLHARVRRAELAPMGLDTIEATDRTTRYLVALVGLTVLAIGAAQTLALALDVASGRSTIGGAWDPIEDLPVAIGFLVVGLVAWAPAWFVTLSARRRSPSPERTATVARTYLYLILGASFVVAVPASAYVLYRLLDDALGAVSYGLVSDIAVPLAVAVVAAVIGAYHAWLVVGDLRMTGEDVARSAAPRVPADPRQAIAVTLVLHGAPDLDVDSALTAVREALPPGAWIETERRADGGPSPVTLVGSA